MASARLETAKIFLSAFATLDIDLHISLRAPTCTQIFAPASIAASIPPKTNDDFATHLAGLREVMAGFPVHAKEMIDSANERVVTIWAESEAQFRAEYMDDGISAQEWKYRGEYIFLLSFDEEGRITRVMEFLDSLATGRLLELGKRARENRKKILGESV